MNIFRQAALNLATKVHEGQFRRDGKTPYITHPIEVARIALEIFPLKYTERARDILYAVCLLHDSVEDRPDKITLEEIDEKFGWEVRFGVDGLTKKLNESYLDSIRRAKPYLYSRYGKIADNTHNLSTLEPKKDKHKIDKYMLSRYILQS